MALFWSFLVACCDSDVWASSSLGARDQGLSEYCWVVVSTGSVRDPGILDLLFEVSGPLGYGLCLCCICCVGGRALFRISCSLFCLYLYRLYLYTLIFNTCI